MQKYYKLTLDEAGMEYWNLEFAGDMQRLSHHSCKITKAIGRTTGEDGENHHNFAWKMFEGRESDRSP